MSSALQGLRNASVISYDFVKSDIKTTIFPISVFAQSLVDWSSSPSKFGAMLLWIWLELLEFVISNQTYGSSPAEDAENKPYRPIPSKLITLENAKIVRKIMPFLNIGFSLYLGVLPAALSMSLFTYLHNEAGSARHWAGKQVFTAALFASGELGATAIASPSLYGLNRHQLAAISASVFLIFSSIHAQDIGDVEGDAKQGRKTLSILHPTISRLSMPTILIPSTFGIFVLSESNIYVKAAMCVAALITSGRFVLLRTPRQDVKSYLYYYNIWLCLSHVCLARLSNEYFN